MEKKCNKLKLNRMNAIKITMISVAIILFYQLTWQLIYEFWDGLLISKNQNEYIFYTVLALSVAIFLITTPLSFGKKYWYFHLYNNHKTPINLSLFFFNNIKLLLKTYLLSFFKIIITLFYAIISFVIPILLSIFLYIMTLSNYKVDFHFVVILFIFFISLFISLILFIYLNLNYYLCDYLLAKKPTLSVFEVIKLSKRLINKRKFDIIKVYLIYLWLIPLTITIVGYFYFLPKFEYSIIKKVNDIVY